jgi:hypothetical protein
MPLTFEHNEMMTYSLPRTVYFCSRGDSVVFLNLRTDEYSMLEGGKATCFRELFSVGEAQRDHTDIVPPSGSLNPHREPNSPITELMENGLLTAERVNSKPVRATSHVSPTRHILDCSDAQTPIVTLRHALSFFLACTITAARLRFLHIETTVNALTRRKTQSSQTLSADSANGRQLVAVFNCLRQMFPTRYLCLFDSIALIEFLARYGCYPDLIFAVRPELWAAHCWVQDNDMVLNEDVEETEDYAPIMVV